MSFYKEVPGRKTTLESTLKFDIEPKAGSTNPVTSGAVKEVEEKADAAAAALQEQIDEIADKASSGYTPKGEATVATLNGLSGQENGELYTMTDAGTLTDGSLAVVAGDTVAWDATNEVWYKAMDYAPRQYGTNEVHNLPTSITAFRTGDVIPVDGPSGTAKMSKDDLLKETAALPLSKVDELKSNTFPYMDFTKTTVGYIKNGSWDGLANHNHICVPVTNQTKLVLSANADYTTYYTFLKSYGSISGPADLCEGYLGEVSVTADLFVVVDLPEDANWVYVRVDSNNTTPRPPRFAYISNSENVVWRLDHLLSHELAVNLYGNRVDDSLFSPPCMYLNADGSGTYNASYGESGLIRCMPGEILYFWSDAAGGHPNQFYRPVCFFDKDKNYVSGLAGVATEPRTITIPQNVYYLSVPIYWNDGVPEKLVIANFLPTKFVPYSSDYEVTHKLVGEEYDPENILNPAEVQMGGYVGEGGNWVSNASFCETGYIPTKRGCLLYKFNRKTGETNWDRPTFAFYDSDKTFISVYTPSASQANCNLCPVPNGASYVRIPLDAEDAGNDTCVGYEPFKRFVPYGSKISFIRNVDILQGLGTSEDLPMSQKAVTEAINSISVLDGTQWAGKKWYAYGTSITSIAQGKYVPYLAAFSSMTATNKGIPGGGIGNLGAYSTGQVFNAICNTTDGKTEADLITLETGANDCDAVVPLGTIYDTTQATLAGCLNLCIRYLQENTNAQIVITPSVAYNGIPTATDKYYEWADMIEKICALNRVYFINPSCNLGYGKLSSANGTLYSVDNIHQTELGGYILAQSMWRELKSIPNFLTAIPT